MRRLSSRLAVLLVMAAAALVAAEPIRYTLRFPAPHANYVEVEASVPASGPRVELMMPVWTPGSYLVREYARNVENFSARTPDGRPLAFTKTRKNRWRVETGGAARLVAAYRVYAREMSVQGNWVERDFAMLNGAGVFMTLAGDVQRAHEVTLILPGGWKTSVTGLSAAPGGAPHHYLAPDFDTLVDCPIVAGNPAVHEFEVAGKKHYLVNEGESGVWDGPASARDVEKIVREYHRMWGSLPYDKYVFFNMLTESGGGLEHKNSTVLMASRWAYRNNEEPAEGQPSGPSRSRWLSLVSHEFFHTWNVKRMRPVELGPFDYENEVYTRGLWIAEGFTSYYGDLALRRAGLLSPDGYLRSLSRAIESLQHTPGRLVQPLDSSSFDSWIKFYRPDENSVNTAISYYTKGQVVAFLLDAKIRQATGGKRSLDDAMKLAYQRYSGARGHTNDEFIAVVKETAGADFGSWFHKAVSTTEELDYSEALGWYGLRFGEPKPRQGEPKAFVGLETRTDGGRAVVSAVRRGTAAYEAGINAGDEILAINDFRVRPERLTALVEAYKPGETLRFLVSRRDRLITLEVVAGARATDSWRLEAKPDAPAAQKENRKRWLFE